MGKTRKAAIYLFAVLVAALAFAAGCGGGRPGEVSYTVRQGGRNGIVVGAQAVRYHQKGGRLEYGGVERRPYQVEPTTTYRRLTVSPDRSKLEGYWSSRRVPGAPFHTYINHPGDLYSYLDDRLQTFDYASPSASSGGNLPFEPDSACLMQALADKFFAAKVEQATALVIVPSRSSVVQPVYIRREGKAGLKVTGEGIGDVDMKFDGAGVLEEATGGGVFIRKGRAGAMSSRPFQPQGRAREIMEVRVPTPDRIPGGERLELAGSLYIPQGKRPHRAVVLAGDFGPRDRTGGGFLSQVAERLAGDGMVVLTCDKRGIPKSQGTYATYTRETAAADLNAQVDYLTLRGDIDIGHIAIVGYGEGGQLASQVAASNPYVSSLVMMAAPSVPLFPDLTLLQARTAEAAGAMRPAEEEAVELRVSNQLNLLGQVPGDYVKLGGHELFLGWMRSQATADPLASAGALAIDVLVVQGGRDAVVLPEQARQTMRALEVRSRGTQELALFEGLGHDFGPMLLEGASVPYRAHPQVDRAVLDKVSGWLKDRK
jgi:pimeloyl-ACP methyl ester carboxylesterase